MTKTYKSMLFAVEGKVARVTLNRPHALNSMPHDMVLEMDAIAAAIEADPAIRVVAFTGAGRAFSAGIDLKALAKGEIGHDYLAPWERFLHRLETMDKLVLCLLHGYFIGGGLQLALACDIRIATPSAKCGLPAVPKPTHAVSTEAPFRNETKPAWFGALAVSCSHMAGTVPRR